MGITAHQQTEITFISFCCLLSCAKQMIKMLAPYFRFHPFHNSNQAFLSSVIFLLFMLPFTLFLSPSQVHGVLKPNVSSDDSDLEVRLNSWNLGVSPGAHLVLHGCLQLPACCASEGGCGSEQLTKKIHMSNGYSDLKLCFITAGVVGTNCCFVFNTWELKTVRVKDVH